MSAIGETGGKLDIGRVIQELFSVLGRNFKTFGLLALILTGIPAAVLYGLQMSVLTAADPTQPFGPRFGWSVLLGIVSALFGVILQTTIIYGTVNDLNERRVSVGDALGAGLRLFLPIIGLAILMGLGIGLASILLIVPGIILAIAWCVAVPAYVIEQTGIMGAFGRSAALTRGNRWRIFGLFLLYIVAALVIELVLGVIGRLTGFAMIGRVPILTLLIVAPLIQIISALIASTGAAVLYVELRRLRDGVGPAGLAAIFD
jgi:hypothetical protein